MTIEPHGFERDLQARVFVIESLSAVDHFDGRLEGAGICELLRLARVPHSYRSVVDLPHLELALDLVGASEARYVHFSCHGKEDGFQLTDGTFVSWRRFHDLAWRDCHRALQDRVVVFSACLAGNGVDAVYRWHKTFCAQIVASTRQITWEEGLAAFSAFYLHVGRETTVGQSVELMNRIAGNEAFVRFKGSRPGAWTV